MCEDERWRPSRRERRRPCDPRPYRARTVGTRSDARLHIKIQLSIEFVLFKRTDKNVYQGLVSFLRL